MAPDSNEETAPDPSDDESDVSTSSVGDCVPVVSRP